MKWHRPLQTARDLARRFGILEEQVALLRGQLNAVQDHVGQLAEESARRGVELDEVRDSVDSIARRAMLRRDPTRVLFLVHLIEAWDSYHEVVRAMEASPDFEPIVVSIPRRFNGAAAFGFEDEVHRGLQRENVAHLRLRPHDVDGAFRWLKTVEPDLVFRQSQWDADIPAEFGTDRLRFARTGLVPYETMNIVQNVPNELTDNSAVDSPYQQEAWVVFCTNDLMLDMARRDGARGGAQFRVAGHPKADRLRAATPAWPLASDGSGTRRIAWSAHHSMGRGWTEFGAFPRMAADMFAWARDCPEIEFVFMPHPALIPYLGSPASPVTRAEFDRWRATWDGLPNTGFLSEGAYASVLAASDLLLTDGLSLMVEYQILERPVVFFERDGHRPFNEIGEIAREGVHTVATVAEARAAAERLLGAADPLRSRQRDIVQRLFGDVPSADRILSILREMIASERGAATRD